MDHEAVMRQALLEARRAQAQGEVPIGAVLVVDGAIRRLGLQPADRLPGTRRPTPRW